MHSLRSLCNTHRTRQEFCLQLFEQCEVSEHSSPSELKCIISDLPKWSKEALTDCKGEWSKEEAPVLEHATWLTGCWHLNTIFLCGKFWGSRSGQRFSRKTRKTAIYSKRPSCTAVKGQGDWQNGAVKESGNIFDFRVRNFPLCEVKKNSNLHTAFRTDSYFPSQRQKILLQTWGQYLKHASKVQIGGKKGKNQITSWFFWDKGRKPLGWTDGVEDSHVEESNACKNHWLVN